MSRLIRAGLDNLGKALRETGQALDRVGLEALGSDSHKELCECCLLAFLRWWLEGVCVCLCLCLSCSGGGLV